MQTIINEVREATQLTRVIAKGLSPVSLEVDGLMEELKHFVEMTQGRFDISCHFDCPEAVEVENSTTASHLFRIAQELVQNAVKHAKPKRILVGLYNAPGGLRLEVTNDGKPFHGPKRRRRGMGWHFIQFRADAIGAALKFFPGDPPDGGTRVVCTAPLGGNEGNP
jgi:two-component system CheB/CheR fusion protein